MKSIMVDGKCPVIDFGVPPRGLAEVRISGPVCDRIFLKSGWLGMRIPTVSYWS